MRILLLAWEFPPHMVGGLGKHVAELVPALAARDVEVHVITPRVVDAPAEERIAPRAVVHRVACDAEPEDNLVALSRRVNLALEQKGRELAAMHGPFDLIHGHDWLVAYSSVALKYALRVPLVVTVHSMEHGRVQGRLQSEQSLAINGTEWWLTQEAWRVITVSQYMAGQVREQFGVPPDKLEVIPNGVTLPQRLLDAAERARERARYAAPDEPIIYYVGRIVEEKGVQVLVDAAPRLLRSHARLRFVVAGTGSYLAAVRQRAADLGVAERFWFMGFLPDADRDKLYQVADVAVFPSLYEPFGIVALEAMAYGCPVVAAQTGGLAEVIQAHETGILVVPGNPDSLAWGILHTLEHPQWTAQRVANARRVIEEAYSWTSIADKTIAAYRRARETWQAARRDW